MRDFCEVKSFTCSLEQVTEHIWVFDYFRCSFKSAVFELFETWGVVSIFKVLWTCQLFCPLTHWAVWANSFLFIESIMLCNYLILQLPPPLALNLSRHQVLSQCIRLFASGGPSWSFNFSISLSSEYSELAFFFSGWLVWSPCSPRDSQEFSLSPQFESISSLVLDISYHSVPTSIND